MQSDDAAPCVGIFWRVPTQEGSFLLVSDRTALDQAETYGDCLTHPRGHAEVWEAWRNLTVAGRKRIGVPEVVTFHEYEDFPRGRIVFSNLEKTFWIYADRRLQRPPIVTAIRHVFGLTALPCRIRSDLHYR